MSHRCSYRERIEWGEWNVAGALRVRTSRRVARCARCGSLRPSRKPRKPLQREREAARPAAPPLAGPEANRVADRILSRTSEHPSTGVRGLIRETGFPGSLVEEWLETFMRCGWVRLHERLSGSRTELTRVDVLEAELLEDFCRPGREASRKDALSTALGMLGELEHPVVRLVSDLLRSPKARSLAPDLIRALAAVARHASTGDACARRVFSARALGDSKALDRLKSQLERIIGPLEDLNIREGGTVVLVGGEGRVECPSQSLQLSRLPPFVGLARETADAIVEVHVPRQGLLIVENMTTFDACCRREVAGTADTMVFWSAGFPGRSICRLVELVAAGNATIRVWADLDLSGVRIFRLIHRWTGGRAQPWRMSPADLDAAPTSRPLSKRQTRDIQMDLQNHPNAPLRDTLEAILSRKRWTEQETLMAMSGEED